MFVWEVKMFDGLICHKLLKFKKLLEGKAGEISPSHLEVITNIST